MEGININIKCESMSLSMIDIINVLKFHCENKTKTTNNHYFKYKEINLQVNSTANEIGINITIKEI